MKAITRPLRQALRRAGRWVPRGLLRHGAAMVELDDWTRAHPAPAYFGTRDQLYAAVHATLPPGRLDYLEFGVAKGHSLRRWLSLDTYPESRFVGFDSWEGLPEEWDASPATVKHRGAFAMAAQPKIDDPRATLVQGWFQDTLGPFLEKFAPAPPVVVHLDADLYSSTLYVLTMLDRVLPDGSVLIFDEFDSAAHEFRAFMDYTAAYRRGYRLLGAVGRRRYTRVAVRLEPLA